ncbi:MAG: hypothetical protein K0S65_5487 [Labilithrix sp.]|nr:hypothetical protein [Labilithrix sp.]
MIMTAALGTVALAAFVACADSDVEPTPGPSDQNDGGTLPPGSDGGEVEGDAGADVDAETDAAPPECSKEGYCHTTLPAGQVLRGVWSDGAGITWAVSEQGRILRYDGKDWSLHSGLEGALWTIWGSSPTDIWIGGDSGLFHSEGASSAGLVFNPVDTPGDRTPIFSIWGSGANDVWAAGSIEWVGSRVLHYASVPSKEDGGSVLTWSVEPMPESAVYWSRVSGSAASGVWATGEWFGDGNGRRVYLAHRRPGATDFEKIDFPRDPTMPTNPNGDLKQIYDAKVSLDGTSFWGLGITDSSNKPVYAAATTPDGWKTYVWTYGISSGAPNDREDPENRAIAAASMDNAFIAGDYARLRHWNGTKWKQAVTAVEKFPIIQPFYAIGGVADDLWFVGDDVALHRVPSKIQP